MAKRRFNRQQPKAQGIIYIVSLGCPKNLVDTEVMAGSLVSNNFLLSMDPEQADVYLINTCAFIPPARAEATAAIEDALEWKNSAPSKRKIVVTGCLVQWNKFDTFLQEFPEVDLWAGVDETPQIAKLLKKLVSNKRFEKNYIRNESPTFLYDEKLPRLQLTMPHIAYLKIADGCNNRCSYCAIPDIRGDLRSRTVRSVMNEAETALDNGARELLVMAQDITVFGADRSNNEDLSLLLTEMNKLPGNFWIRLLYTHPAHFPQKLIDTIGACDKVLPYVDMPLQHISGNLLDSMHRHISEEDTRDLIKRMRKGISDLTLRTTFITGLPGETEDDYKKLKDFIIEQEFERLGVFSYSPEPGTPAASFPNQVPHELAEERALELMDIQSKISLKNNKLLVGREFDVIVDFIGEAGAIGRSYMDAPEIDNYIVFPEVYDLNPGDIYKAVVSEADTYELTATLTT